MTEEMLKGPGKYKLFVLGELGRQYFSKKDKLELDTGFRYTVPESYDVPRPCNLYEDVRIVRARRAG